MAGTAPLRINESIAAAGAFDNAACARFAIWAPSQAAELDLSAFALAVVPARELVGLLQGAGTLSQESFGRYLVCQGGDCAAEGEWASVTNLDPALQYYTVAHLDGWVNESSAQTGAQTIYYMQQPLGIDACATQLPDRPGVEASHQGSNVGALAGERAHLPEYSVSSCQLPETTPAYPVYMAKTNAALSMPACHECACCRCACLIMTRPAKTPSILQLL